MGYKIERAPGRVLITFDKMPPQKTRNLLQGLGYRYNARWKCWVGKKHAELLGELLEHRGKEANRKSGLFSKRPTLCWDCKNACGGCEWSKTGKPVDGWTAEETSISGGYTNNGATVRTEIASYFVVECPEFVKG